MKHDMVVNLDYASHTPVDPRVLLEFNRVEQDFPGNVMAAHTLGRQAHREMERVTAGIAELLGVMPGEVIFTSGASEANNLAIKGIVSAYSHVGRHVLSTCLEHPSVSGTLAATGCEIELLKILPDGTIDLAYLKTVLRRDTVLLCISAVDSELGVVQPIGDIVEILKDFPQCHLHVDAAQAIGKIHISNSSLENNSPKDVAYPYKSTMDGLLGASTFCLSPHKFYGLCGVGILVKRQDVVLQPLIHGGTSTTIYRSGTPTLSLAASAYTALQLAMAEMDQRLAKVAELRDYTLQHLSGKDVRVNTPLQTASPYILNISVAGIKGTEFQAALDGYGICVSVKSACSTDRAPSRAVFAITRDKKNALSSWRISFSHLTTMQEIDTFLAAFEKSYKELTAR